MKNYLSFFVLFLVFLLISADRINEHDGFDDLRSPSNIVALAGASVPSWVNCFDGIYCLAFDDSGSDDCVSISTQLPHRWKFESNLIPHVHHGLEDNTNCNIVWTYEYSWAEINAAFPASTTDSITVGSGATTHYHNYDEFSAIDASGFDTLSSQIIARLCRDGDNGADTCNGKLAYLWEFDIHYNHDSIGSVTAIQK